MTYDISQLFPRQSDTRYRMLLSIPDHKWLAPQTLDVLLSLGYEGTIDDERDSAYLLEVLEGHLETLLASHDD